MFAELAGRRGALLCTTLAVFTACGSPSWPIGGEISSTAIPCAVPAGQRLEEWAPPLQDVWVGPQACAAALTTYLHQHADERIGMVTPEYLPVRGRSSRASVVHIGTQALRVEHTDHAAPWPLASTLAVVTVRCGEGAANDCAQSLEANRSSGIWQWIPLLAAGADDQVATDRVLLLTEGETR